MNQNDLAIYSSSPCFVLTCVIVAIIIFLIIKKVYMEAEKDEHKTK